MSYKVVVESVHIQQTHTTSKLEHFVDVVWTTKEGHRTSKNLRVFNSLPAAMNYTLSSECKELAKSYAEGA